MRSGPEGRQLGRLQQCLQPVQDPGTGNWLATWITSRSPAPNSRLFLLFKEAGGNEAADQAGPQHGHPSCDIEAAGPILHAAPGQPSTAAHWRR